MAGEEALLAGLFGGALAGVIMGFLVFFVILFVAVYIYMAIALQAIAKKTKTKDGWWAWIPIMNLLLMLKIAKLHWAWIFVIFVGWVPFLGQLALAAGCVYVFWKISEAVGKPGWMGILMIVPIANLIVPGILAWSK